MRPLNFTIAVRSAICLVAVVAMTSCSSTPSTQPLGETIRSTVYKEGVPGGVIVETTTVDATVAAIDTANRTVTVAATDGRRKLIGCGPEVVNFDQIRVGDHVHAVIKSELVLALAGADTTKMDADVTTAALAPKGDKPGGVLTKTQEYTATVTAINQRRHEVTLRLPDDTTRTFSVRPDVDLSQRKVGTQVAVRVSVAVAITVTGP